MFSMVYLWGHSINKNVIRLMTNIAKQSIIKGKEHTHNGNIYLRPHTWSDCPEVHTSKLKAAEKKEDKKRERRSS